MGMNVLENLEQSLAAGSNEVFVDKSIAERALLPLDRMVKFAESNNIRVRKRN